MPSLGKTVFLCLLAAGFSAWGLEDFSSFNSGDEPPRPKWGTTAGKHWKVTESGDDHGKVLEIRGDSKRFGRCDFPEPCPKKISGLLIEFDFKVSGAGNQEIGVLDKSSKLADYYDKAAMRLKFDGNSGTLQYRAQEEWNDIGSFNKENWNHLRVELFLMGPDAGQARLTLNEKDMGKFSLDLKGKNSRFERIWFTDQTGSTGKLFIDNLNLEYRDGADAVQETSLESPERVKPFSFYSKSLQKECRCFVVLPSDASANQGEKRYPLLIVLHGRGRNASSLLQDPAARRALMNFKGAVLLVQGDDGWYIDSPVKTNDRYGSMMNELIETAKKNLPVSPSREAWGIAGWSMGGYGAAMTAEAHPDQFSSVALLIGLMDYPRAGLPEKQSYSIATDRFGRDPAVWPEYNPITKVKELAGMKLFMRTGVYSYDLVMNRNFKDQAEKAGIFCDYKELPGGHEFPLVCRAMYDVVEFMNRNLQQP